MSIYLGNTKIGQMYLGSTKIAEAYLGSTKVYEVGGSPTPPTPATYDSEIEYLAADGYQYIDTLVPSNSTIEFEVDYEIINNVSTSTGLLSFRLSTQSTLSRAIWIKNGNVALNTNGADTGWKTLANGRHLVTTNGVYLYADGYLLATAAKNNEYSYEGTIGLMRGKKADESSGWDTRVGVAIKLYSCKIYSQGVLAREFVPVRVGQVGYLYDKVSGNLFANAGSGDFVLGDDIAN